RGGELSRVGILLGIAACGSKHTGCNRPYTRDRQQPGAHVIWGMLPSQRCKREIIQQREHLAASELLARDHAPSLVLPVQVQAVLAQSIPINVTSLMTVSQKGQIPT